MPTPWPGLPLSLALPPTPAPQSLKLPTRQVGVRVTHRSLHRSHPTPGCILMSRSVLRRVERRRPKDLGRSWCLASRPAPSPRASHPRRVRTAQRRARLTGAWGSLRTLGQGHRPQLRRLQAPRALSQQPVARRRRASTASVILRPTKVVRAPGMRWLAPAWPWPLPQALKGRVLAHKAVGRRAPRVAAVQQSPRAPGQAAWLQQWGTRAPARSNRSLPARRRLAPWVRKAMGTRPRLQIRAATLARLQAVATTVEIARPKTFPR
mmetsp:Transcript_15274/g.57721  ORF Transcript_15274/g.57721 Transcript_15274/m.57721 type:complete len:265 (+) Transcript_15274:224-1018(+)